MRVLVTGASGFLGSWLCRSLHEQGHELKILARPKSDLTDLNGLPFKVESGDVTNLESMIAAANGIDTVFHLAGLVAYRRSDRPAMNQVNVAGTENVLRACQTQRVRKLVHMSSVTAIGASFDGRWLNEESKYNVGHLDLGYFETKRKAEELVREAANAGKVDAVILNPGTVYGPADAKKGSRKTQIKVAQGKFPFYPSGGVNVVSVHEVVKATLVAWEKGETGQRYILGGENLTIKTVFDLIAEAAGVKPPRLPLPNFLIHGIGRVGDLVESMGKKGPFSSENAWTATLFHWFDSTKAQRELGLRIRPAREAITESVHWMKENGLLDRKTN